MEGFLNPTHTSSKMPASSPAVHGACAVLTGTENSVEDQRQSRRDIHTRADVNWCPPLAAPSDEHLCV